MSRLRSVPIMIEIRERPLLHLLCLFLVFSEGESCIALPPPPPATTTSAPSTEAPTTSAGESFLER